MLNNNIIRVLFIHNNSGISQAVIAGKGGMQIVDAAVDNTKDHPRPVAQEVAGDVCVDIWDAVVDRKRGSGVTCDKRGNDDTD